MHTGTLLILAVVLPALDHGPARSAGQEVVAAPDSVISRVLEAHGGVEAVRAIDSHRQEGLLVALQAGAHGRLYRIARGPENLDVLVQYPDRSEYRILAPGSTTRGPAMDSMAEVSGPLADAMVLQGARSWLPGLLDERRADTRVEGSANGRTVLAVAIGEGMVLRVFVEEVTGLIVRSESVLGSAPGGIGFATDYSDFRSVDGVVFAFREETWASGIHTGSTVLESVEVNPRGERAKLPPRGT